MGRLPRQALRCRAGNCHSAGCRQASCCFRQEIEELLRLVRRDTLTLLYGVSGLGKTSLLQAGFLPALRAEDCLPAAVLFLLVLALATAFYGFSSDGARIVTLSDDNTVRIWDVAVDLKAPLPNWVAELAEALGGQRFKEWGDLGPPKRAYWSCASNCSRSHATASGRALGVLYARPGADDQLGRWRNLESKVDSHSMPSIRNSM